LFPPPEGARIVLAEGSDEDGPVVCRQFSAWSNTMLALEVRTLSVPSRLGHASGAHNQQRAAHLEPAAARAGQVQIGLVSALVLGGASDVYSLYTEVVRHTCA
jgi:hypothetical protein